MTNQDSQPLYLAVSMPVPLRRLFDYTLPKDSNVSDPEQLIGCRVRAKFGPQELIGVIVSCHQQPSIAPEKIRSIEEIIDKTALIPTELLKLCHWAASYYHHPIGEVIQTALPQALRQGKNAEITAPVWQLTTEAKGLPSEALKRARKQQEVLQYLLQYPYLTREQADSLEISNATLNAMLKKGLLEKTQRAVASQLPSDAPVLNENPPALTEEQQNALKQIHYHKYTCYLLEGATGSGKTEVYLQIIASVLQRGLQVLLLIPEIGLTPQTLSRIRQRFNRSIAELHSNVSESQRCRHWINARDGKAQIVVGTRLASLTPMHRLGAIIIDEEHDLSFKQQDGLRYSARDLSIYRARHLNIPVILGSATPSLESLHNAIQGRYEHLRLTQRAGNARAPKLKILDLRQKQLKAGLCEDALNAINQVISRGHQALVFINRRGYAPTLLCHVCGWYAGCPNCDARLTLHSSPPRLHCHHCGVERGVYRHCPSCGSNDLNPKGLGTEQTEQYLQQQFTDTPIIRIDRDSTQQKMAMQRHLERAAKGEPCILIGTQMLAKGHHLPKIALVVVVDGDQGLLSADFRGAERMGQLITQVAGRAGREEIPGTVLIQSHTPDHPLLELLLERGYHRYARELLGERHVSGLPPYTHMVVFRAESKRAENATAFLSMVATTCASAKAPSKELRYLGPIPARMEKLNERFRYQLQITASSRRTLQELLGSVLESIDQHALSKRTRWSVDVDALEV